MVISTISVSPLCLLNKKGRIEIPSKVLILCQPLVNAFHVPVDKVSSECVHKVMYNQFCLVIN